MAQNVDMTKLEAQLTRLEGLSGHISQLLESDAGGSYLPVDLKWELNDFSSNIKQATTELQSYSQRWRDATIAKSEDVTRLERREAEIREEQELLTHNAAEVTRREQLLKESTAEMAKKEMLLEHRTAQMATKEELLQHRAAEMSKKEEALEQKTREREAKMKERSSKLNEREAIMAEKSSKLDDREALIQSKSQELQADIKVHIAHQDHTAKEVGHLVAREATLRVAEDAMDRKEDNLKRHQQAVMQLHQMTGEKLDSLREERAEERKLQDSIISYNITTRQELKAEAAKVNGLIKKLRNLKSSIATPLHNCETALADIKERAQSLNLAEAEQQIAALKGELALVSSHTDRQMATIKGISKYIEAVDNHHTRMMDRQFDTISAKLTNVSEVSTGLDALFTRFQEIQLAESNATDRMIGAAEELRNGTETGSKAREALQKVLGRSNARLFNDNTAKRGAGLSSPEKPATKRPRPQHIRGSSAGAAEVLANVEASEFGSPSRRRIPLFETPRTVSGGFGGLAPFAGQLTVSRSGPSSSAVDLTSSSAGTIISSSQNGGVNLSDLSAASDHVRNFWRQIEFPADWTEADSAKLLVMFNAAKEQKGAKAKKYWPQQAMDVRSKSTKPYCLTKYFKKLSMQAREDGQPCEVHPLGTLCLEVFYTSDSPGDYDLAATDKRWRLEKRQ